MSTGKEILHFDGAPAHLRDWLAAHPDSTLDVARRALKLKPFVAYTALARLHDLKLVLRVGGTKPAKWRVTAVDAEPVVEAAAPRCEVERPRLARAGDFTVMLQATGTLVEEVLANKQLQVLSIAGQRLHVPRGQGGGAGETTASRAARDSKSHQWRDN